MKTNTGSIWYDARGAMYARITFVDDGKQKSKMRRAENVTDARQKCKEMLREMEEGGKTALNRTTFNDLAEFYRSHFLVPAKYVGETKVHGLKSYKEGERLLTLLSVHFGDKTLREISFGDLHRYKVERQMQPILFKTSSRDRSIASVNRELSLLRRLFRVAKQERWITRSPFEDGSLISASAEVKRDRILSEAEERQLLDNCSPHVSDMVVLALETGARRGEILSLKCSDIDLDLRVIKIRAIETKTNQKRDLPISNRLFPILRSAVLKVRVEGRETLFTVKSFNTAWKSALRRAGLTNLRFHDLRATFATRMLQRGLPLAEVSKLLGHATINTTYVHYIGKDELLVKRAADLLNGAA